VVIVCRERREREGGGERGRERERENSILRELSVRVIFEYRVS